jgi:hypothetical protein
MIISLMSHLNNSRNWVWQNLDETKHMIEDILKKMKKKSEIDV